TQGVGITSIRHPSGGSGGILFCLNPLGCGRVLLPSLASGIAILLLASLLVDGATVTVVTLLALRHTFISRRTGDEGRRPIRTRTLVLVLLLEVGDTVVIEGAVVV